MCSVLNEINKFRRECVTPHQAELSNERDAFVSDELDGLSSENQ